METPWVRFSCFLAFVPCFLLFVFRFSFLIFSCIPVCLSYSCPFVCAAAICYSQKVRILWSVFFLLGSFVPYPISEFFCFYSFIIRSSIFFRNSYFSFGWLFLLLCSRTRYAINSTWFAYLDSLAFGFSLSHCGHIICIALGWRIRKDTGGTADVAG